MAEEQQAKKARSWPRLPKDRKFWLKMLILVGAGLFAFRGPLFGAEPHYLSQAELLTKARHGKVAEVVYEDDTHLVAKLKGDKKTEWKVTYPKAIASDTFKSLNAAQVAVKPEKTEGFPWGSFLTLIMIIMWGSMLVDLGASYGRAAIAKLKGQTVQGIQPGTKFDDVKGLPEVVGELSKIAHILKNPDAYTKLGARLPAGVVLYGPSGTGKTLLAKALAGEAGVPFYEMPGSSVRSKWIGQASRAIRAYFEKARQHPVSIIFMDEGDTLASKRTSDGSGGSDEHRAMVNELLTQMNPGRPGGHVFVIIATNHEGTLDPALTRPGRIDLKLAVPHPDVNGRKEILTVHTKGKLLAGDVDMKYLARETYGKTGADIEALVNNAMLEAGARGADRVGKRDFDHALTLATTGPAREDLVVSDEDRLVTAYHEAGHALCAAVQDKVASPTRVTILAHGSSGGHTSTTPDEETISHYLSRRAAMQQLIFYMGGVAGEKLALDADFTNGPASDRQAATNLAIEMVCRWGMGTYNSSFDSDWRNGPHADEVWAQVEAMLDEAELAAINLLLQYKTEFDDLVAKLLEKETLRASDLQGYRPRAVDPEELAELKKQYGGVIGSVEMRRRRTSPFNGQLATAHA